MRSVFFLLLYCLLFTSFSCTKKILTEKEPVIGRKQHGQLAQVNFSDGMKEFILGNYPQAQTYFEKTLSLSPDNAAAQYMQARIFLQLGNTQKALENAMKALQKDPKNKYYYILTAQIYQRQQNFSEAIQIYKKLISEIPGSDDHYYDLALSYIFQGQYDEALKTYNIVEARFGKSSELTRQKQQLFLKMNKLDLALQEGRLYIADFPEDADFKVTQGEILYSNDKKEEAAIFLDQVIKQHPENGAARLLLLEIYKEKKNTEKTLQQLDYIFNSLEIDVKTKIAVTEDIKRDPQGEIILQHGARYAELLAKNHPEDGKALVASGEILMLLGKDKEAWQKFLTAKKFEPGDFDLWGKIISLDAEFGKTDSMVIHSEQALEVFPNQAVLWLYNGTAYLIKKNGKKAVESFEQGLKLSSANQKLQAEFNMRLGDAYNEIQEYEKSDKAFDEILRIDRENEHVLNNYSYYLSLRKEKLEQAKDMSETLIKKFPGNASYLDTYAWVLYMLKDFETSKKYLEIAVVNSNNGTILEHYGDVLYQLGEKEKALEQWQKAKQLGEHSPMLEKKIQEKTLYE
jgi:tetratricopeptide (TPR) repeat protein